MRLGIRFCLTPGAVAKLLLKSVNVDPENRMLQERAFEATGRLSSF